MTDQPASPAPQKTSTLSIVSLCLAMFGLSIPAIICGHIAKAKIKQSNGLLTGNALAIAGLAVGYVSLVAQVFIFAAILLPAVSGGLDKAKETHCRNNLRSISMMLYSSDNFMNEPWPNDLAELDDIEMAAGIFVCPATGHEPGAPKDVMNWMDYTYIQGQGPDARSDKVLLYCPPENHKGKSGNAVLVSGAALTIPAGEWDAFLQESL